MEKINNHFDESNPNENEPSTDPELNEGRPGSKSKIILFGFLVTFQGFYFTFGLSQFSNFFEYFIRGKFGSQIPVEKYDDIQSLLNTMFFIGTAVGCLVSGKIFETQSPRKFLYVLMLLMIIFNAVQIWANLLILYILRFCIGLVVLLLFLQAPILINQLLPTKFAGVFGSIFLFLLRAGAQVATLITSDVAENYWQLFIFIPVPLEIFRFTMLLYFFPYESPYYVYDRLTKQTSKMGESRRRDSEAISLDKPPKKSSQDAVQTLFIAHPRINLLIREFYIKADTLKQKLYLYNMISKYKAKKQKEQGICKTACSDSFRRPFVLGVIFNLAHQFSGVYVILLYSKQLFIGLGVPNADLFVFLGSKRHQPLVCCSGPFFLSSPLTAWAGNSF